MGYFSFELEVLKRAYSDTAKFVASHIGLELSIAIFTGGIGAMIYPRDDSWQRGLIVALAALGVMVLTVGIFNLFITPYRIWREQKDSLRKKAINVGLTHTRRISNATKRVKVPFPQGIKYLMVKPYGEGSIKIAVHDAPSDAVADAWLEPDESVESDILNFRIYAGKEEEFKFTSPITRIDIVGDSTITSVEIVAQEEWPSGNT